MPHCGSPCSRGVLEVIGSRVSGGTDRDGHLCASGATGDWQVGNKSLDIPSMKLRAVWQAGVTWLAQAWSPEASCGGALMTSLWPCCASGGSIPVGTTSSLGFLLFVLVGAC